MAKPGRQRPKSGSSLRIRRIPNWIGVHLAGIAAFGPGRRLHCPIAARNIFLTKIKSLVAQPRIRHKIKLLITRKLDIRLSFKLLLAALGLCPLVTVAQTLTITNGIQTYGALTNTTVTMTGRCELRLTTTNNPSPGCIINLTSPDAWVLLPNIKPSVVSASYLSQQSCNCSHDSKFRITQSSEQSWPIDGMPKHSELIKARPHVRRQSSDYYPHISSADGESIRIHVGGRGILGFINSHDPVKVVR